MKTLSKPTILFLLAMILWLPHSVSMGASAVVSKALIGEQDINRYTGTGSPTFTRPSSTGGTLTLNKVGYEVDALISYGGGTSYTQATIEAALNAIGSNVVTLLLRPGGWAISTPLAFPANVTLDMPSGAYFTFSGTGAVSGLKYAKAEWFGTGSTCLNKALAAAETVEITTDITKDAEILMQSNRYLFSRNMAKLTGAYELNINSKTDIVIDGLWFDDSGAATSIGHGGSRITVKNCRFSGTASYHVAIGGTNVRVTGNEFTETPSNVHLGFTGNNDFIASENNFHDIGLAYVILTRSSSHGTISNNTFTTITNNPIFIDTASKNITITGNVLRDTGDSGILIGNDLAGTAVTGVTISGNVIENSPATGIGAAAIAHHVTVTGNTIRNCGSAAGTAYDSGVLVYGTYWTVTNNVLIDDQTPVTMTYGIHIQPLDNSITPTAQKTLCQISGNVYQGPTVKVGGFYNSGNLFDKIRIDEGTSVEYPVRFDFEAWTGAVPTDVAELTTWSAVGAGITTSSEAAIAIRGSSGKVISAAAGGGFDLSVLALGQMATPCIVELTGYVRGATATDAGQVSLNPDIGGNVQTSTVAFSGTTWTPITIRHLTGMLTGLTANFYANIGKTVYFDEFVLKIVHYGN